MLLSWASGISMNKIYIFKEKLNNECIMRVNFQIMPIFSTTERRFCPKIYIHTFPEIKKVAVCKLDTGPSSYLSCCFTGTEYLVSLTSYPLFQLIIWLWRTGEKIHSVQTALTDLHQTIE